MFSFPNTKDKEENNEEIKHLRFSALDTKHYKGVYFFTISSIQYGKTKSI
jgi:hypothetical protein